MMTRRAQPMTSHCHGSFKYDQMLAWSILILVQVCGHCTLFEFKEFSVLNSTRCPKCNIRSGQCQRQRCGKTSVDLTTLGQRTLASLSTCETCLAGPEATPLKRCTMFDPAWYLKALFQDKRACEELLKPFEGHYSVRKGVFRHHQSWHAAWRTRTEEKKTWIEATDGDRFVNHPIIKVNQKIYTACIEVAIMI